MLRLLGYLDRLDLEQVRRTGALAREGSTSWPRTTRTSSRTSAAWAACWPSTWSGPTGASGCESAPSATA